MNMPRRPQPFEEDASSSRPDASPVTVPLTVTVPVHAVTEGVARPPPVHALPTWAEVLKYLAKVRYFI